VANGSPPNPFAKIALAILLCGAAATWSHPFNGPVTITPGPRSIQSTNNCVACHQQHGEEAHAYSKSIHQVAGISCTRCHGGNVSADQKDAAHSGRFVGKFQPAQIISTCGSCHSSELALFKTSKHFPGAAGIARLDCAQCHGAHNVGSPARDFSYAYYCSGCHGLEYLPELNKPFQQMLMAADAENDAINTLNKSGGAPSAQQLAIRKQVRKLIAQIVHGTDYQGGQKTIPDVLALHEQFKSESQKK